MVWFSENGITNKVLANLLYQVNMGALDVWSAGFDWFDEQSLTYFVQ